MAAMGIPLPAASGRLHFEKPPAGGGTVRTDATGRFAANSIAALRSLPPRRWLKGTP
jgi:hypothetical protein